MIPTFMQKILPKKKKSTGRVRPPLTIMAKIGAVILVVNILLAFFGPVIAPYSPSEMLSMEAYAPVGKDGILGTDYIGRDLLSRLLHGARLTIGLALLATIVGFVIGMALGFFSAEAGGWVDNVISRVVDVMISFPPILLSLVVIAGLGSSLTVLVCTVGIIHASRVARVARVIAMEIGLQEFVDVARARGEKIGVILWHEILPNTLRPLGVEFGVRVAYSVLLLAALSFLGLGIQPPAADWGGMVRENMSGLLLGSWAPLLPAAAIALLAIGINLIVDWMVSQTGREISTELR
jgi:peptide/nickel transport system permease protein